MKKSCCIFICYFIYLEILIISIFFRKTSIIRSISDELEERIRYEPDNPCRAKKNTNNFFISNFTILTQLCDFFLCFDLFFNTNNFLISNFTTLTQLCDFFVVFWPFYTPAPRRGRGYTVLPLSVCPSVLPSFRPAVVQDIFHCIFLSNCWWQNSDIWSQASYRYTILWEAFLDPSDSYFLFADLIGFYTHFSQQLLMAEIWYLVTSFI